MEPAPPSSVVEPAPPAFVVGTAGHIDHGKSALVHALTGIDPDRLEEEQRRGMTIDLGFAHLDLPGGRRVGIVDVPGHERLIKNMLAGAGGMDLVLLVIAADEGVMPQTREHLDLLRFLRVERGVVVVTKTDLVEEAAWLDLIEADVRRITAGTFLAEAPVVRVSALTGAGLEDLVSTIDRELSTLLPRGADGPARLPIDRVFTMTGFGTVVTGTVWSGRIRGGDVLEVLPAGSSVRVRQVQRHGERAEEVTTGARAALNLTGVQREDLSRGMVLATPRTLRAASLLDVGITTLPGAVPVAHLARLRFYLGTDEVLCRIALLDRPRLEPGTETLAQLRMERPVVAARGDRFVVRRYSPAATLGGGEIIALDPPRRRRGAQATADVAALAAAGFTELVAAAIADAGLAGISQDDLAPRLDAQPARVAAEVERLATAGTVVQLRDRLFAAEAVTRAKEGLVEWVREQHAEAPWRLGVPREEAKRRIFPGADDRLFAVVLQEQSAAGVLVLDRGLLRLPTHRPVFGPREQTLRQALLEAVRAGGMAPPGPDELRARLGVGPGFDRMLQSLLETGDLVEVAPGILFAADALRDAQARIQDDLTAKGEVTVAQVRDTLGTSRKYALALLEYLDAIRVTRRIGDRRVAGAGPAAGTLAPGATPKA